MKHGNGSLAVIGDMGKVSHVSLNDTLVLSDWLDWLSFDVRLVQEQKLFHLYCVR